MRDTIIYEKKAKIGHINVTITSTMDKYDDSSDSISIIMRFRNDDREEDGMHIASIKPNSVHDKKRWTENTFNHWVRKFTKTKGSFTN